MTRRAPGSNPDPDPLHSGTADDIPPQFERLVGDGAPHPRLVAAALRLRRELLEQYDADSAVDCALVEGAATSYYLQQLLTTWTAGLAATVEREIFAERDPADYPLSLNLLSCQPFDNALRRFSDQVVLQERATRLRARNLAALRARQSQG